ncbi:MAG: hypothetical protein EAZ24_14535 [Burkholderiales bacterium]|nr:MAG: hypothetical protein EAZ24_14535 [Burkholderiales bacterium]
MYYLHCTKKLLDRARPSVIESTVADSQATTVLGNWYATALFWKPQLALLVNETSLLPVLMPLAPAAHIANRFPAHLAEMLAMIGISKAFIDHEIAQMASARYAKSANRSVLGVMKEFVFHAETYRDYHGEHDPLTLSLRLAHIPCSPLDRRAGFPDREVQRIAETWTRTQSTPKS